MIFISLFYVLFTASALKHTNVQQPGAEMATEAGVQFRSSQESDIGIASMTWAFRTAEKEPAELEDGVLVFIPGESENLASNLRKTMRWLQTQTTTVDCIIYQKEKKIRKVSEAQYPCKLVEVQGTNWMEHILQVPLNGTAMKYVLHLMGNVEVQAVDLDRMIKAMEDNNVVHAAPALYGKSLYPQVKPHLGFGRKVNFLEYHMDLFTRSNFACLQDLVDSNPAGKKQAAKNHYGWFMSEAMAKACPGKLAVLDSMKVFKLTPDAYNKTEAFLSGQRWLEDRGWEGLAKAGFTVSEEPLKGELMPGDPQCNGDMSCVCPTTCETD